MRSAPNKLLANVLVAALRLIRPILGPTGVCSLQPTCTEFAKQQLMAKPLYKAAPSIVWRLLKCFLPLLDKNRL